MDDLFVYGTSITVQFSANSPTTCISQIKTNYYLFRLNNFAAQAVLAIGAQYLDSTSIQLTLIDSAGSKTVLPRTFLSNITLYN